MITRLVLWYYQRKNRKLRAEYERIHGEPPKLTDEELTLLREKAEVSTKSAFSRINCRVSCRIDDIRDARHC